MGNWEDLRKAIDQPYFRWALKDMEREILADFPYLSALKDPAAERALHFLSSLGAEERFVAGRALVKRFHARGAELEGSPPSADEARYIREYLGLIAQGPRTRASPRINRRRLMHVVRSELTLTIGTRGENFGAGVWRYQTGYGRWVITTYVDASSSIHQLVYDHRIGTQDFPDIGMMISVLSWLGVSAQTNWQGLEDVDIPETASLVARLCGHFLEALPEILPDDTGR